MFCSSCLLALSTLIFVIACVQGCDGPAAAGAIEKPVNSTATKQDSDDEDSAYLVSPDAKHLKDRKSATDDKLNTCRKLCSKSKACENSKQKSFCKWDQETPACFGLFWTDRKHSDICFIRDGLCKEGPAVQCGIINATVPNMITTLDFLDHNERINSCQGLCQFAPGCNKSFCWERAQYPTCANLFWTNGGSVISPNTVAYEVDVPKALREGKVPVECGVIDYKTDFVLPKQTTPAQGNSFPTNGFTP